MKLLKNGSSPLIQAALECEGVSFLPCSDGRRWAFADDCLCEFVVSYRYRVHAVIAVASARASFECIAHLVGARANPACILSCRRTHNKDKGKYRGQRDKCKND